MARREPSLPLSATEGSSALSPEEALVVRTAFEALRAGERPAIEELAKRSGLPQFKVDEIVEAFVSTGRAQLDQERRISGIVGLTLDLTRHRIELEGTELFTWCAFDAIGIPAALRSDAAVSTVCRQCGEPIEVEIRGGLTSGHSPVRGWLPTMDQCANVRNDFCPDANLFCSIEHLNAWRNRAGMPDGLVMDLDALIELGGGNRGLGSCERRSMMDTTAAAVDKIRRTASKP